MTEEPTPKKSRVPLLLGAAIVVLAVIANMGGGSSPTSPTTLRAVSPTPTTACKQAIKYHVEGSARTVSITMQSRSGNMEQVSSVALPMKSSAGTEGLSLGEVACGEFLYISAQNNGETGTVTCRITSNGVTIEEASSSGAFVIASCSGSVPRS